MYYWLIKLSDRGYVSNIDKEDGLIIVDGEANWREALSFESKAEAMKQKCGLGQDSEGDIYVQMWPIDYQAHVNVAEVEVVRKWIWQDLFVTNFSKPKLFKG